MNIFGYFFQNSPERVRGPNDKHRLSIQVVNEEIVDN